MKITATTHLLPRETGGDGADACIARVWGECAIAVLADGAGAARAGVEAARRVVHSIAENFGARPREWNGARALEEFVTQINRALYQDSLARFESPELVSTLACVAIEGDELAALNVGDSRIYLHRGGKLERLSEDHVDPEQHHVLTRAMGLASEVRCHLTTRTLQDGDLVLLCSDGVTNVLTDDDQLGAELTHRISARTLVQSVRNRASDDTLDDLSAVILDIDSVGRMRSLARLPLPIPEDLTKGQLVDGYELFRPLAGSNRVWIATRDGRRWILKFAPIEARDEPIVLEAFIRESWNASRIDGPAFVPCFTPDRSSSRYYVQEFIDAPSLKALLKSRPLGVEEAIALGRTLCDAGTRLLRLDLVHGDLKPENILAVADYDRLRFKLIDFGSSAEVFSVTSRAGTASYLAPERFHGAPISERTEIFALGVTLYEALTRRFPFGEIERFQTPVFSPAKAPSRWNPNIPAWLDHLILRCLSLETEHRYQHFSEVAFAFDHPDQVEPFFHRGEPLLTRNPLAFYRAGFWALLAATLCLLLRLISQR